jgi:hypothetical protein
MKCKHKLIKDSQGKNHRLLVVLENQNQMLTHIKKIKKQGEFLEKFK